MQHSLFRFFLLGTLFFSLSLVAGPSQSRPFTVHELLAMERIGAPQASPDGQQIVFSIRKTNLEKNKGEYDLYLVDINGNSFKRLTTHPSIDTSPCWSMDGQWIYFLSARSEFMQVWRIRPDGGEAERVTSLDLDINDYTVVPSGKGLLLSIDVFPGKSIQETSEVLQAHENSKATGKLYNQALFRHWDVWADGRFAHLFYLDFETMTPVDLMSDMQANAPTKPWGGMEEIAFTPDEQSVIFTAKDVGDQSAWSTNYDLFKVPLDGTQAPECLTATNKAWDTQPTFSPDGKTLAYLAMARPGFEADQYHIMLRDWQTGTARELGSTWDRSPSAIFWSPDGKILFAVAENLGQLALFAIDVKSEKVTPVIEQGTIRSPVFAGERIVFGLDHLKSPVELYSIRPDGKDRQQITHVNDELVKQIAWGEPEQFTFKGWNNETVYGYVVKPANFDPAKEYPVAFLIHGGPQGSFGNDFHYRWNPQAYAGAGYAAVMIDFHGSTGYGQAFTDAIRENWGSRPFEDLQKGLAAALVKYPWLDGDKVGALGASYGGYMINWIAGNWPDRFKCLVNHDGNFDIRMAYYDTEELWFPEWEHGGTPWERSEVYELHNPVNHVDKWKTPMLVVHGELDYRVPVTQGIGAFNALQRKDIPSQFLCFPDENHWVLKPHNSILWHNTVIGWLDKWLK